MMNRHNSRHFWRLVVVVHVFYFSVVIGHAQGNTVIVSVGTGISSTEFADRRTPTEVLHGRIDGSGNLPAPSGYAQLWYASRIGGSRSEVSFAVKDTKRSGRIYAENKGLTRVGAAFSNPNTQEVTLSFFFTDSNGMNLASGNTTIPANSQIAAFLGESPFNAPAGFEGTFTFNASSPLAVLAVRGYINEIGFFLMPQVPIGEISGGATPFVPYFANGTGCVNSLFDCREIRAISTELILVNPTDSALSGTVTFHGQGGIDSSGQPVPVTINGQTSAVFPYSIAPRSSRRFATAGRPDLFQHGYVQIASAQPDQGPMAFGIMSFETGTDRTIRYQTTVIGQAPASAFRLPVHGFRFGGPFAGFTTSTGVVITNPSSTSVGVSLDVPSMNATTTLTLPGGAQIVITPQEHLQLSNGYNTVLRVSSISPILVAGLQQFINQFYGALAIEAFDESVPTPGQLVFPHLAVGDYRSSLLLFKTSDSQASAATIRFFSRAGEPVDPQDFGLLQ
jgi:hypothetical protein